MNKIIKSFQDTQCKIMNDEEFIVYVTLLTWKELSLEIFSLEVHPLRTQLQQRRLVQFKNMQSIFNMWMKVLNADERYIIKRHIIDGISWKKLENELHNKSKRDMYQNQYTLHKVQRTAITKIAQHLKNAKRI